MQIIVDDEFKSLIPPLSVEEHQQLTVNILRDGVLDPLKVWEETGILIDGHNRQEICQTHEVTIPAPQLISFKDRDAAKEWIIKNQFGRRNLSSFQRSELALTLESFYREKGKANQVVRKGDQAGADNFDNVVKVEPVNTRARVAAEAGVSEGQIAKVKAIQDRASEDVKAKCRSGEISINQAHKTLAKEEHQSEVAEQVGTNLCDDILKLVEDNQKFACIYADPPWQYGNQSTRAATDNHYPTMSMQELIDLPVDDVAAENAHLHLWTTNGFIQEAFILMEKWGFEYKSMFLWVKPQMGIGNYWRVSHEIMLLGVRGSLSFKDKSLRSWGEFKRGKHSAKPNEVRAMIERASPGPRLELFGRSEVEGWTVFGNQIKRDLFSAGLEKE